jgi:arginyl-tRNA synthetase
MYILQKIKNDLADDINKILGKDIVNPEDIVYPKNLQMGDLSLPTFKISKDTAKNSNEAAKELKEALARQKNPIFKIVSAVGPYLNIKLDQEYISKNILTEVFDMQEKYGRIDSKNKERVMIEFSNVNTHKEYHIGHLRNVVYGDSVTRILNKCGNEAIPVSYVNDFGIHVAKTLWAYLKFYKDAKAPENKGEFLAEVYAKSSSQSKDNEEAKKEINEIMQKIESRNGKEYELWEKTREWSIDLFDAIYKELGIVFQKKYYESEYIDKGKELVDGLIKKGILKKSQGAVIADLEEFGLGVLVVLRSDGTATYPVADIPLAEAKFKDFDLDKSIYVVDDAQALYFEQLFKILELLGYKQEKIHLRYGSVKLPSGKMSSRLGNTVTYAELKKRLLEKALKETAERHEDWNEEQLKGVAWELAKGAMKFEMIKVGADQTITFDIEKALAFQGYTCAYLQYSYARIRSIMKKSEEESGKIKPDFSLLTEEKEHALVMKLAKYPEAIRQAGASYDPSEAARYLFELAQLFNDYYHAVPVLKAEKDVRDSRLFLIIAVNQVIKNGLGLLGIGTVDEM